MRFFVFTTLLFFVVPSVGLISQDGKHSTRKKSSTKKKTSKSKSSTQTTKPEVPREEVKFFHENWAMEETEFPSDFTGVKEPLLENSVPVKKETVSPVSKPPLVEPKKTDSVWDILDEYKKLIFIAFIILVFALYRIRGGGSGKSSSSQDRFFTRLKNK